MFQENWMITFSLNTLVLLVWTSTTCLDYECKKYILSFIPKNCNYSHHLCRDVKSFEDMFRVPHVQYEQLKHNWIYSVLHTEIWMQISMQVLENESWQISYRESSSVCCVFSRNLVNVKSHWGNVVIPRPDWSGESQYSNKNRQTRYVYISLVNRNQITVWRNNCGVFRTLMGKVLCGTGFCNTSVVFYVCRNRCFRVLLQIDIFVCIFHSITHHCNSSCWLTNLASGTAVPVEIQYVVVSNVTIYGIRFPRSYRRVYIHECGLHTAPIMAIPAWLYRCNLHSR